MTVMSAGGDSNDGINKTQLFSILAFSLRESRVVEKNINYNSADRIALKLDILLQEFIETAEDPARVKASW